MSNSPLVEYTLISPNKTSPRNQAIDRITPHCVVGQCTAESLGGWFAKESTQASSNYGIDKNGRVGMYVEEKDRSWCTSSGANDHRAITIECASDTKEPYTMNDAVYEKLIVLCADICKRNGKTKLLWFNDKDKTLNYTPASNEMVLTVHRWFANKSCPGEWLFSRLADLATKVNALLGTEEKTEEKKEDSTPEVFYRVQIGAFSKLENAEKTLAKAKAAGFSDAFITKVVKETSPAPEKAEPTPEPVKTIQVGSKVQIKNGAKSYEGATMMSFVYGRTYTVDSLSGERAVLDKNGLCTAFNVKDLILV